MDGKPHSSATAQRRQKQIEDCLFENMMRTPYSSISISDICRQVGISRKAFYNYYRDKDACFCAVLDRILQEAFLYTSKHIPDSASPLEAAVILLDYWKGQKVLFDTLLRNSLFHLLMLRNMNYILEEDRSVLDLLSTPEVKSDTDILACYMSIQITLVLQWYYRDFDTPTEEMARKFLRILHAPMILPQDAMGKSK